MQVTSENDPETSPNGHDASEVPAPNRVSSRYKIIVGILVLTLIIVGLLWFQQSSLLQLQNNQLSSHSSSLSDNVSDLRRIVGLQKTQMLADDQLVQWSSSSLRLSLTWPCSCFQYSGYLHMNWTSKNAIALQIVQFGLNITTPTKPIGDFNVPISGGEAFTASFIVAGCNDQTNCGVSYSAVYHY